MALYNPIGGVTARNAAVFSSVATTVRNIPVPLLVVPRPDQQATS
jgi:hypothetical protein